MSTTPQNDAQRELEQRALRNVRGLVEKMEDLEAHDARTQRRYLLAIVVGGVLVCVALATLLWVFAHRGENGTGQLIEVAKPAPAAKP
ncbi:MAG TPA: hypothetical protein VH040_05580 [Usitatibacter sp.]|jgi:hypothetical protein|nr:hypothetical protein [Usitatibacter sp.]